MRTAKPLSKRPQLLPLPRCRDTKRNAEFSRKRTQINPSRAHKDLTIWLTAQKHLQLDSRRFPELLRARRGHLLVVVWNALVRRDNAKSRRENADGKKSIVHLAQIATKHTKRGSIVTLNC